MRQIKRLLNPLLIISFIVVAVIMLFNTESVDHIEDINGEDVYTLQTITDDNIINRDIGAKGFSSATNKITNKTIYSSDKFTGVEEVYGINVISSDFTMYINMFRVYGGNVKLVLLKDDVIVHEFEPNESFQSFTVACASGSYISLRIAGESVDFELDII